MSEKRGLIVGLIAGAVLAGAGVVVATRSNNQPPEFVDVVRTVPVTRTVETPREECTEQPVTRTRQRNDNTTNGTVIGALVGGVLGNQVGGGSGRALATVGGAVAGGYVGHEADKRHTKEETVTEMQRVCNTVVDRSEETIGYDVTYVLDGKEQTIRLEQDPGKQLKYASLPAPAGG